MAAFPSETETQRARMVGEQLARRGIRDPRVLAALGAVPRHVFVDPTYHHVAYGDHALPIGYGQTISQPYMVALMTERLDLLPGDRVLEVGTGSGYQTAVLARLVARVYTVERLPELSAQAGTTLGRLGIDNVTYRVGDGTLGWPAEAPFHGILVAAGAPEVPPALLEQLRTGGRLVIPVGPLGRQGLRVYEKREDGEGELLETVPCAFVPLIGVAGWPADDDEGPDPPALESDPSGE